MFAQAELSPFLQQGAMGVLALAFLATLGLWLRTDKRSSGYARHIEVLVDELRRAHVNEATLISVIKENTAASVKVAEQLNAIKRFLCNRERNES